MKTLFERHKAKPFAEHVEHFNELVDEPVAVDAQTATDLIDSAAAAACAAIDLAATASPN